MVLVEKLEDGVALVNAFAPEHLSLIAKKEKSILPRITTSGAIFLGNYSPSQSAISSPGRATNCRPAVPGKSFPGLTVDMFQRRTSIVKLDPRIDPQIGSHR
jgi:histidinol dehydrogenase